LCRIFKYRLGFVNLLEYNLLTKLVTIKSYLTPSEAMMLQSILSSEDIYCFLKDENSVIMQPYLANSIGGIKLQVREPDVERAVDILKTTGFIKDPPPPESWFKVNKPLIILFIILLVLLAYKFLQMRPVPVN
jgi:hypothetical protein